MVLTGFIQREKFNEDVFFIFFFAGKNRSSRERNKISN
jgi:hypothetical protein